MTLLIYFMNSAFMRAFAISLAWLSWVMSWLKLGSRALSGFTHFSKVVLTTMHLWHSLPNAGHSPRPWVCPQNLQSLIFLVDFDNASTLTKPGLTIPASVFGPTLIRFFWPHKVLWHCCQFPLFHQGDGPESPCYSTPKINWSLSSSSASFLYLHSGNASLSSDMYESHVWLDFCFKFLKL